MVGGAIADSAPTPENDGSPPHLPAGLIAASTSAPEQASLDRVRRPLTQFATPSRSFRCDRERTKAV
jgi:hypothetical protein